MLLADEVGLGKTIVARGVIGEALKAHIEAGHKRSFKVTYICSNQVIAKENLKKLKLLKGDKTAESSMSRIAYLAGDWKDSAEQAVLELNTLTPATSFNISQNSGVKWERRTLFAALTRMPELLEVKEGLKWILLGSVRNIKSFQKELENSLAWKMREDIEERFRLYLKETLASDSVKAGTGCGSLFDAAIQLGRVTNSSTWTTNKKLCNDLCVELRRGLIECCVDYVDSDLFILDEFQRFSDLIDNHSTDSSTRIARRIFFGRDDDTTSKILLLSATPFKAFSNFSDLERGEDHYRDFRRVLEFLLRHSPEKVIEYDTHRKALYDQMLKIRGGDLASLSPTYKNQVEAILRSVICRTERQSVTENPNALIEDVWKQTGSQIPFSSGDIENFRETDRIARALARIGYPVGKPVDYCKSALFPLSFLDQYQLKERLRDHRDDTLIREVLDQSKSGWLDLESINRYAWSINGDGNGVANARLKMLVGKSVGQSGARLLWIPPSLPYYSLDGPFAENPTFSKTLIFSSWTMVPRMVSTLLSYQVEKQTIGNPDSIIGDAESRDRTYFRPEGKGTSPAPQIVFNRRRQKDGTQLMASMSNFTILYPCLTLAGLVDPVANLSQGKPLEKLVKITARQIRRQIRKAGLKKYQTSKSAIDGERWYWAAPLLLDRDNPKYQKAVAGFFEYEVSDLNEADGADESKGRKGHLDWLQQCYEDPDRLQLGPLPKDLPEVLARAALGSPAVILLRAYQALFPGAHPVDHIYYAFDAADQIATRLLNRPEAISAIRLSTKPNPYWQRIHEYFAAGCFQSVIDEYLHLLQEQNHDMESATAQLKGAISLRTVAFEVDSLETFKSHSPSLKMRTHYAVPFGNQRFETDEGQSRASSIREAFNSPFRPFVLTTTSIGQEGLDFHQYCRRIVHWNLPGNPVDLEQREGRINRYKSHVIRQRVAGKYGKNAAKQSANGVSNIWNQMFEEADRAERHSSGNCELIPYWHLESDDPIRIERIIPMYPFSIDQSRMNHILKSLVMYRLAFGQPRQSELVDHLLEKDFTDEEIKTIKENLMINLSPVRYLRRD